jgi:hypothetical protein
VRWLNLTAVPLLFIFGWFFSRVISLLRSINPFPNGFWGMVTTFSGWGLIVILLSVILMLVFHELIHGLFFWIYTHVRPKFALKSGYAFAAAPEWYLPKFQYITVGISPLVVISLLSIVFSIFVSAHIIPYLVFIATFNAAGALGDMIVVAWVIRQSKTIFINDLGDKFSTFSADN